MPISQFSTRHSDLRRQLEKEGERKKEGEQAYFANGNKGGKAREANGGRCGKANGRGKCVGVDHERCFKCNHRGHMKGDCTPNTNWLEQCDTCSGVEHNSKECPTPTTPTEKACVAVEEEANFVTTTFGQEYDRVESMFKTDPGWEKLTEEENEENIQGFCLSALRAGRWCC